jgi:anti-anti-sigma factor
LKNLRDKKVKKEKMNNSIQNDCAITLSDAMTIYNAALQKTMLLEALSDCQELNLDLSQVSEMDTAGFQVLLLVKRESLKANKTVRLSAHSKSVTGLLDLYNMASYFGDPMVIPA